MYTKYAMQKKEAINFLYVLSGRRDSNADAFGQHPDILTFQSGSSGLATYFLLI